MTEPPAPERIGVIWSPEARADLRAIDRTTKGALPESASRPVSVRASSGVCPASCPASVRGLLN